jgi:hypothetical protein
MVGALLHVTNMYTPTALLLLTAEKLTVVEVAELPV